jgi:hypothetical protein
MPAGQRRVDGPLEALRVDDACEVEQRARGRGDGEQLDHVKVMIGQAAGVVDDRQRRRAVRASIGPDDVGGLGVEAREAPQPGRRGVRQRGTGPGVEDGGGKAREHAVGRPGGACHAVGQSNKPTLLHGIAEALVPNGLPAGKHAVLPLGGGPVPTIHARQ